MWRDAIWGARSRGRGRNGVEEEEEEEDMMSGTFEGVDRLMSGEGEFGCLR